MAKLAARTGKIKDSRVEQRSAQDAHNVQVAGSNPASATSSIERGEDVTSPLPHAGESPAKSPASPTLEWLPKVKGFNYQKSSDGNYTVSASRINGQVVFQAFYGSSANGTLKILGYAQKSAQEARELAQAHATEHREGA